MRKDYQEIIKKTFHRHLIQRRAAMNLTQAEMAVILEMDVRSYADLDRGRSCCGTLTFALFLLRCCDDPLKLLNDIREAILALNRGNGSRYHAA